MSKHALAALSIALLMFIIKYHATNATVWSSHFTRRESAVKESASDYLYNNTLAHLDDDRFLAVIRDEYPKNNCNGFRFFRAADMCIDFDRIGFIVSIPVFDVYAARYRMQVGM